jgi:hypothetical protein
MTFMEWATKRATILAEEGATIEFIRGFLDFYRGEEDATLFIGNPFGADDYYSGRQFASYLGPVKQETVIRQDGSVLTWAA